MSQTDFQTLPARKLSLEKFRLETLLAFWVACIMLPAAAIFALLNFSQGNAQAAKKAQITETMLETLEKLQLACQPEEYFADQIKDAENMAGLPPRNSGLFADAGLLQLAPQRLQRQFSRFKNHDLLLLLVSGSEPGNVQVFHDQQRYPEVPRPGNRAALEVMQEYAALSSGRVSQRKTNETGRRLLKNFTESIFGIYLNPVTAERDFTTGFSERLGGCRLLTARRRIVAQDGKQLFSYIAVFREGDNSLVRSFAAAKKHLAESGFSFRMVMRKTIPFPFIFERPDGGLSLYGPVPAIQLLTGYFRGSDIFSALIRKGIMKHKPAIYPHFEVNAPPRLLNQGFSGRKAGFIIFLLLCSTLLAVKSFHQHGLLRVNIRGRLFLSVLIATALPAAVFIFYAQRYVNLHFELRKSELGMKMKNHLKLLELAVKSKDQAHSSRNAAFIEKVRSIANVAEEKELHQLITTGLDHTFSGVGLVRNDGIFIEKLDTQKAYVSRLENKLNITREFMYASIIRFFELLKLMQEKFNRQLQSSSRGKKLLALAQIFLPMDIDNFCSYEGTAQTSKQDFGNFRMMNYKFLPSAGDQEAKGAVLLLIQDIRDLATQIINESAGDWSFFRHKVDEGMINITIISCFDLNGTSLDPGMIWPPGQELTVPQLSIAQKISMGKSETISTTADSDGTPIITAARKIAGYPLIAVAECRMSEMARQRAATSIIITGNLLYILLLLTMLATILNELFTPPLEMLLTAARLTGEGTEVVIQNSFDNELAQLTGEFNLMSRQIKERERLERFISREASRTIASESLGMSELKSQKARRSMLFIHIRNFSHLNAILSPAELLKVLNIYFPFVEELITREGGQIDKYISDAVMAVFADQTNEAGCAQSACRTARALRSNFNQLNMELQKENLPVLSFGAGISTGEVISGRIGSYQGRLDYTVIGDRVNLAARLEALSHIDDENRILIDEETFICAQSICSAEFHGEINVKGKARPVKTYELKV